ncbi:MAG TPA: response regulator [Gemmatimonadales bacterium]|nr:response regulator [Gemmatimonadales bacterium]
MAAHRILFIDDDRAVVGALANYFRQTGNEVHTAPDGKAGIALHERVRPDVTVLDLHMPGMSGMEVLEVLRDRGAMVIMLTGYGEIDHAVQAMRLGAENFLTKPVDMAHLVAAVDKAAEKGRLRSENVELRARLTPTLRRQLVRVAAFAALIVAAMLLGRFIGGGAAERPTRPIPVPFSQDTATLNPVAPMAPGVDTVNP